MKVFINIKYAYFNDFFFQVWDDAAALACEAKIYFKSILSFFSCSFVSKYGNTVLSQSATKLII